MDLGVKGKTGIARFLAYLAVATAGGAAALAGASLFGQLGGGQTVRQIVTPASSSTPTSFDQGKALSINEIYRRWAPGVVQITSTSIVTLPQDPLFGNPFAPQTEKQESLGSGFVTDKAGHIVTNYHVIEGAKSVQVSFSNGENVKAQIVGSDPSTDVAVLRVDAHSSALTPLAWGNSDDVQVGDSVVAIGNPFGYTRTVTAGIVSAVDRPLTAPNEASIQHGIQTDAALNHGNSGGPLINARGEVIGVSSQIPSPTTTGQQGNLGIGFAIPSNTVRNVVAQIIENGHVEHALLGVRVQALTPSIADLFRLPVKQGLLVARVTPGTAAAKVGLKGETTEATVAGETWALGGDIIVRADGVATTTTNQLSDIINNHKPGDTIELVIYRRSSDGTFSKKTIEVKLGRQPSSP